LLLCQINFVKPYLGVLGAQSQSSLPTARPVYRPYKGTINISPVPYPPLSMLNWQMIEEKQITGF
jgi:hypothetical protein